MTYLKLICQNDDAFFVSRQQYDALKRILRPSSFILLNLTERAQQTSQLDGVTARLLATNDEYFPLQVSEACIIRTVPAPRDLVETWFDIFVDNNTTGLLAASIDSKPKFFDLLYVCVLLDVNLTACKHDVVRVLETATSSFESEATWSLAHDRLSQLFFTGGAAAGNNAKPSTFNEKLISGGSVQPSATKWWWPSVIATQQQQHQQRGGELLSDSQQTIVNSKSFSNFTLTNDAFFGGDEDAYFLSTGFELDAKRGARYAAFLFQSEILELRESAQAFLCALVQLYPLTQLARALENRWPSAVNDSLNMNALRRALCDALLDAEICPYKDEAHLFADLIAFHQSIGLVSDAAGSSMQQPANATDTALPSSVDFSSQDEREREDLQSHMSVAGRRRLSSNNNNNTSNGFWRSNRRIPSTRSHPSKVREALGDARLSKIRFGAIPVHRFEQQIIRTGVLSERECVHLLNALSGNTLHDALEQQQQRSSSKGRLRGDNNNYHRQAAVEEILRHDVHLEQLLSSSTTLSYKPRYYLPANLQDLHCSVSLLQAPSMVILTAAVAAGDMDKPAVEKRRSKTSQIEQKQQQPPIRLKAVPCTCPQAFFVCKLRVFEALVFGDYLKPVSTSTDTSGVSVVNRQQFQQQNGNIARVENAFDDTRQWEVLVKEIQLPQYYIRHGLRVEYRIISGDEQQQQQKATTGTTQQQFEKIATGIESNIYATILPYKNNFSISNNNRPGTGSSGGKTMESLTIPKINRGTFSTTSSGRARHGTVAGSDQSSLPSTIHVDQTPAAVNIDSAAPSSAALGYPRHQNQQQTDSQIWRAAKIYHAYSPPALLLRSIRALRRELTISDIIANKPSEPVVSGKSSSHARRRSNSSHKVEQNESAKTVDSGVDEVDDDDCHISPVSSFSSLTTTTQSKSSIAEGNSEDLALCQVSLVDAVRVSVGQELQVRIFFNNENLSSTRYAGRHVQRTAMKMGPFNVEKHFVLGDDGNSVQSADGDAMMDGTITASGYVRGECVVASNCGAIPAMSTYFHQNKRHRQSRDSGGVRFGDCDNLPPHLLDPLANSEYYGKVLNGDAQESTHQLLHPSIIDFRLGCLLVQDSLTA